MADADRARELRAAEIGVIEKRLGEGKPLTDRQSQLLEAWFKEAERAERAEKGEPVGETGGEELAAGDGLGPVEAVVRVMKDGRILYPESYKIYGERFGKSDRTVRSWVAIGQEAGKARGTGLKELPPLHDANALVLWWRAHMTAKIPDKIVEVAIAEQRAGRAPVMELAGAGGQGGKPAEEKAEPERAEPVKLGDLDVEIEADLGLRQARALAETAYNEMRRALEDGLEAKADRWRKVWMEAVSTQRVWEKDYNRIMEERGHLLRKNVLVAEIVSMAAAIARNVLAQMVELLETVAPEMDAGERRALAVAARDECFKKLRASEFSVAVREGAERESAEVAG